MSTTGRIHDWSDAEGKTIRAVVQHPSGKLGDAFDAVIVFDDDSWMGLRAMPDGRESAYLELGNPFDWDARFGASDYLHPEELLSAGLVNEAQRDYLLAQQADELRAEKARKLAKLKADAEAIERDLMGEA